MIDSSLARASLVRWSDEIAKTVLGAGIFSIGRVKNGHLRFQQKNRLPFCWLVIVKTEKYHEHFSQVKKIALIIKFEGPGLYFPTDMTPLCTGSNRLRLLWLQMVMFLHILGFSLPSLFSTQRRTPDTTNSYFLMNFLRYNNVTNDALPRCFRKMRPCSYDL